MEKLPAITAKIDPKCTGTSQHWTIENPGDEISGGLYVSRDLKLPAEITISFLAGSKEHEINKEDSEDDVSSR